MYKRRQRGFTLLEILVVISIIGILIALGTAAYTTAQKKGRDARRKADIKAIQNGFEQFRSKNGDYPTTMIEANSDTTIFPAGVPEDPKGTNENVYNISLAEDSYCACALMESTTANASSLPGSGSTTCNYGEGSYYCLSNLQ